MGARPRPFWACWLGLLAASVLCTFGGQGLAQGRNQPAPPASKPTLYNPDPQTCQVDNVRSAFQHQLSPYADQSATVLARLRNVQAELLEATLQRCVAKDLMDGPTARSLAAELLGTTTKPGAASTGSPQSPSRP